MTVEGPVPRVLVVDHHDSYTWNLVHLIASVTGELPAVTSHDEPIDFSGFTHLVLSPGPGRPDQPADFALGRIVFELGLPVLGVCLGMQALITSFGGTVDRIAPAHGEVGTIEHDGAGLFSGVPDRFRAVRYHSLGATRLPPELRSIAIDATDHVVMAVVHRELPLAGVQFHPESILSQHGDTLIRNFLAGRINA